MAYDDQDQDRNALANGKSGDEDGLLYSFYISFVL